MAENESYDQDYLSRPEESLEEKRTRIRAEQASLQAQKDRRKVQLGVQQELATRAPTVDVPEDPEELAAWNRRATARNVADRVVDIPRGAARGGIGFVEETFIAAKDLSRWVLPLDKIYEGTRAKLNGQTFSEGVAVADAANDAVNESIRNPETDLIAAPESTLGGLTEGVTQFMAGFVPVLGQLKGVQLVSEAANLAKGINASFQSTTAAAITSAIVFDPDDPNLANLMQEYPELANPVTEFLATQPGDSQALNRLKNSLAEMAMGPIADGFVSFLRGAKNTKWQRLAKEERLKVETTKVDDALPTAKELADERKAAAAVDGDKPAVEPESPLIGDLAPAKAEATVVEPTTSTNIRSQLRQAIEVTPDLKAKLIKGVENGELLEGDLKFFNGDNIDWEGMAEGDSIKRLLLTFEDILEDELDGVVGGVRSLKDQQKLADLVGLSAEDSHKLFTDVSSERGLSARMLAAHQTMLASAARLKRLADTAKASGANADRVAVHRQIELHAAIMGEVKGSQKEIARALGTMRVMKQASEESFKEFDDIIRNVGGHKNYDKLLDELLQGKLRDVNQIVIKTTGRKVTDVIQEIVINGLLSGLKTHVINLSSNLFQLALAGGDKFIAAAIGRGRAIAGIGPAERVFIEEANRDFATRFTAMGEAFRLGRQAFVEGKPVSDVRQRLEFDTRKAIKTDRTDLVGQGINAAGEIIRLPGRALIAGDEVFKHLNKSAELVALSNRQAAVEAQTKGLTGEARSAYIAKRASQLADSPTPEIQAMAIERARVNTFQESPRTTTGRGMERFINANPLMKMVVAPFLRTPMNILRQVFVDRTPLSIFLAETREILKRGGAEADVVLARMTTGTAAIGAGYYMMSSMTEDSTFQVRGKRDYRSTETLDNVPDYSYTVDGGKTWHQYNRLDPIGSWLGWTADLHAMHMSRYDPNDPDSIAWMESMSTAALSATMSNALNKSWLKSANDIVDGFKTMSEGGPAAQRGAQKLVADQLTKLIPYSSALRSVTSVTDPVARDGWTVGDRLMEVIPGLSGGIPETRDMLGRPVRRDRAEYYWVNPFGANPESQDPLDQALSNLAYQMPTLDKSLHNGKTLLTSQQWSDYKELIGQNPHFGGRSLEDIMREQVQSESFLESNDEVRIEYFLKPMYEASKAIATELLMEKYPELRQSQFDAITKEAEVLSAPRK